MELRITIEQSVVATEHIPYTPTGFVDFRIYKNKLVG